MQKNEEISISLYEVQASRAGFGFYLVYCMDYFIHFTARFPVISPIKFSLIIAVCLLTSLFLQLATIKSRFNQPIVKKMNILFIFIFISLPFVEFPGSVLKNNMRYFIEVTLFLYCTVAFVDSDKRIKIFIFMFLSCQIFRVLEPLYLNIFEGYWGYQNFLSAGEFVGRLSGAPADLINPNELGFIIVTLIPYLHFLLSSSSKIKKIIHLTLLGCLLYTLILTMSRGAFIVLFVVLYFIYKGSSRKGLIIFLTLLAVGVGWGQMDYVHKERYLSLFSSDARGSESANGRVDGMFKEFSIGLNRPIVGHGLGTTPEAKAHLGGSLQASHILYAELLIEIGALGFIFFITLLVAIRRTIVENFNLVAFLEKDNVESNYSYYFNVHKAINVCFWMFIVYSINYWGLSQYYWYLLAGLTAVINVKLRMIKKEKCKMDNKTLPK